MEENKLNVNELVKITTMPTLMYQLDIISERVDEALKDVDKMECNEDNKKDVKNRKQDITKFKNAMETKRKEIKNKMLEPYDLFESKYNETIKVKLENAEKVLESKYKAIEEQQKIDKENVVREFANKHIIANDLQEFVKYEDIGIKVTLSASEKSLKEQAKAYVDKVVRDIELINLQEYSDEIMVEYKATKDLSGSILKVKQRKEQLRRLEEIKAQQEERRKQEQEMINNVHKAVEQEIVAPKEIKEVKHEEVEPKVEVSFKVIGTKEQIKGLVSYITENKIEYRNI